MSRNSFLKTALIALLGGGCQLWGQADIGQLTLSGPNFGYQTVSLLNLTGATDGCELQATQYNVCNSVNISTWSLELDFTANVAGLVASPLTFSSIGPSDAIGPTDLVNNPGGYTGQAGNPWSLSFDNTNVGCNPSCDANITKIVFSGTLDQATLQLGTDPTLTSDIPLFLTTTSFTTTWVIPSTDYTASPDSLYDSTDILISNREVPPSATPEPRSFLLILAGLGGIVFLKRTAFASMR